MSRWTLDQLTTTQVPNTSNTPNAAQKANLAKLVSGTLEPLYEKVGPFKIESAFRSEPVNRAVGGGQYSNHLAGLAADLAPAGGAKPFAARILADPALRALCGEIIVNSDRIVHISAPTKVYAPKYRSPSGSYVPFTNEELQAFIKQYAPAAVVGVSAFALIGLGYVFLKGG